MFQTKHTFAIRFTYCLDPLPWLKEFALILTSALNKLLFAVDFRQGRTCILFSMYHIKLDACMRVLRGVGVWNSLISKNLAHYSLCLIVLLIL